MLFYDLNYLVPVKLIWCVYSIEDVWVKFIWCVYWLYSIEDVWEKEFMG